MKRNIVNVFEYIQVPRDICALLDIYPGQWGRDHSSRAAKRQPGLGLTRHDHRPVAGEESRSLSRKYDNVVAVCVYFAAPPLGEAPRNTELRIANKRDIRITIFRCILSLEFCFFAIRNSLLIIHFICMLKYYRLPSVRWMVARFACGCVERVFCAGRLQSRHV